MNKLRVLILNDEVMSAITAADLLARAKPVPWVVLSHAVDATPTAYLRLQNRSDLLVPRSEQVLIPVGYRAAISYEHQPAGLVKHLSVSVDTPGNVPGLEAFTAIAQAFGMEVGVEMPARMWIEEFEPGHGAINLAQLVEPIEIKTEGTA